MKAISRGRSRGMRWRLSLKASRTRRRILTRSTAWRTRFFGIDIRNCGHEADLRSWFTLQMALRGNVIADSTPGLERSKSCAIAISERSFSILYSLRPFMGLKCGGVGRLFVRSQASFSTAVRYSSSAMVIEGDLAVGASRSRRSPASRTAFAVVAPKQPIRMSSCLKSGKFLMRE